jgi:hypothetical protein
MNTMGERCENTLVVEAVTPLAVEQLKDFVYRSKSNEAEFKIENTFPMPEEVDFITSSNSDMGLAILLHRDGDDSMIKEYLNRSWIKDAGIKNLQELERFLIESKYADMELGQRSYKCLIKYGAKDEPDWRYKNWGTRYSYEQSIMQNNDDCFRVYFHTKNAPPEGWLSKISTDYPNLKFELEWVIFGIGDGIINASNGELIFSERMTEDW